MPIGEIHGHWGERQLPEAFWSNLFGILSPGFKLALSWILLIGVLTIVALLAMGAYRFATSIGRENRIVETQKQVVETQKKLLDDQRQLFEEQRRADLNQGHKAQLATALQNIGAHLLVFSKARTQPAPERIAKIEQLLQRIMESIATDVKAKPGEHHRCGLWWEEDGELVLVFASAGFPRHYFGRQKATLARSALSGRRSVSSK